MATSRLLSRIYTYKGIQFAKTEVTTTVYKTFGASRRPTQVTKNVYAVKINGNWKLTPTTTIAGAKNLIDIYYRDLNRY